MRRTFLLLALLMLGAGAYHLMALVHPVNATPAWRHALFAAIDGCMAWGLWRRPPWFLWVFAILAVQQLMGHGVALLHQLRTGGHIDPIDPAAVLFVLTALTLLILDTRRRRN